jgi:hypothetical protein
MGSRPPGRNFPMPAAGEPRPDGALPEIGSDLDVGQVSATVQDGLLMVFGPDGDPVPPRSFAAAAEVQPEAPVALGDGRSAPAGRVARILEAQLGGSLATPDAAGPWLRAMLGLGPLVADASAADLDDEADPFEIILCGETLSITTRGNGAFRLTPAAAGSPGALGLYGADDAPVALEDALAGLRATAAGHGSSLDPAIELVLAGCSLTANAGGLAIVTASGDPLHLRPDATGTVALHRESGEPAAIDELAAALGFEDDASSGRGAAPPPDAAAVAPEVAPASDAQSITPLALPLCFRPPLDAASDRTRIAVVYLRGLPEAASLTAGSANGDGGWMLSAEDLEQVALLLPEGEMPAEVVLHATAIVIEDQDGAMATVTQEVVAAAAPAAAEPIVLPLELADLLADCGGRPDAVLVGGVPADAQLSAGRFDPGLGAWVVRPAQTDGLALRLAPPPPGRLTLKVTVVAIERPSGRTNAVTRLIDLAVAPVAGADAALAADPAGGIGFFRPLAARRR